MEPRKITKFEKFKVPQRPLKTIIDSVVNKPIVHKMSISKISTLPFLARLL